MVFIAVMTALKTTNIQMKSVAKFNKPDQVISVSPRHFPLAKKKYKKKSNYHLPLPITVLTVHKEP